MKVSKLKTIIKKELLKLNINVNAGDIKIIEKIEKKDKDIVSFCSFVISDGNKFDLFFNDEKNIYEILEMKGTHIQKPVDESIVEEKQEQNFVLIDSKSVPNEHELMVETIKRLKSDVRKYRKMVDETFSLVKRLLDNEKSKQGKMNYVYNCLLSGVTQLECDEATKTNFKAFNILKEALTTAEQCAISKVILLDNPNNKFVGKHFSYSYVDEEFESPDESLLFNLYILKPYLDKAVELNSHKELCKYLLVNDWLDKKALRELNIWLSAVDKLDIGLLIECIDKLI